MSEEANDQLDNQDCNDQLSKDIEAAAKLVKEIPGHASDVSKTIKDLRQRLKNGEFQTEKGISLLDAKCHMMLEYLSNLVYIIMKKVSGNQIENDPAIERLVESRVVLEKMKPIEQRLNYQIQKVLTAANTGTVNADDPLNFKPNPDNFMSQGNEDDDDEEEEDESKSAGGSGTSKKAAKSGVYVPPRIAAAYYDGDETEQSRQQKMFEQARKRALSSSVLQELRKQYDTGPEEIREFKDVHKEKIDSEMKERERYEEEYFTRLPLTKKQKHDTRRMTTMSSLSSIARFDDISALEMTPDGMKSQRRRSSKKFSSKKGKGKRKSFKRKSH